MKKIIFAAILAVAAIACSKESTTTRDDYPPLVGVPGPVSYFLPAYVRDEDAPPLKAREPIILQYYSQHPYAVDFLVYEGETYLASVSPEAEYIIPPPAGYYSSNFPLDFLVPDEWAGKLITIRPNDGTTAFTKFRVLELEEEGGRQ